MMLLVLSLGCHQTPVKDTAALVDTDTTDTDTTDTDTDADTDADTDTDTDTDTVTGAPDCREEYVDATLISFESVTGEINSVDPATGATSVFSILSGMPKDANLNSSAFRADATAVVSDATHRQLVSVDPCSGVVTVMGATGVGALCGVAYGPGGHLYGLDGENNQLVLLDEVTGAATVIGGLGFDLGTCGLAYDCVNDQLMAVDGTNSRIFKVDPATGLGFDAISTDVAFGSVGAEYDPRDETILASTGSAFYRIEITTGAGTRIAPLNGEGNWDDLAYLTAAIECP